MKHRLLKNIWPKLITLALAVATWFYVFDMADREFPQVREHVGPAVLIQHDLEVKGFNVEPVFVGRPPSPYRARLDKVEVSPREMYVFGPRTVLEGIDSLRTEEIDLSRYKKSVELEVSLEGHPEIFDLEGRTVKVHIPVEREVKSDEAEE